MNTIESPNDFVTLDSLTIENGQQYEVAQTSSIVVGFGQPHQAEIQIPAGEVITISEVTDVEAQRRFSLTMRGGLRLSLPLEAAKNIVVKESHDKKAAVLPSSAERIYDAVDPSIEKLRESIVQAHTTFFTEKMGGSKGNIERLKEVMRTKFATDLLNVERCPSNEAVVQIKVRADKGSKIFLVPLKHNAANVDGFFEASSGEKMMLAKIRKLIRPGEIRPDGISKGLVEIVYD